MAQSEEDEKQFYNNFNFILISKNEPIRGFSNQVGSNLTFSAVS